MGATRSGGAGPGDRDVPRGDRWADVVAVNEREREERSEAEVRDREGERDSMMATEFLRHI